MTKVVVILHDFQSCFKSIFTIVILGIILRNEFEIDVIRRISKLLDGQGCKSDAGGYVTWSLDQLGMICGCCAF